MRKKTLWTSVAVVLMLATLTFPLVSRTEDQSKAQKKSSCPSCPKSKLSNTEATSRMQSMYEAVLNSVHTYLAKPETAERLASFAKNYYDALVKKGFTKEQALEIVIEAGIPTMSK